MPIFLPAKADSGTACTGAGTARLRNLGQACTETVCKNMVVPFTVALPAKAATSAEVKMHDLVQAR